MEASSGFAPFSDIIDSVAFAGFVAVDTILSWFLLHETTANVIAIAINVPCKLNFCI
jgi:hypothetical protein